MAADKPRDLLSCAVRCCRYGVHPPVWVRGRDVSAAASRGNRGEPLVLLMPCRLRQGKRTSDRSQPCDRRYGAGPGLPAPTILLCAHAKDLGASPFADWGQIRELVCSFGHRSTIAGRL
jgi:hypothetical protein